MGCIVEYIDPTSIDDADYLYDLYVTKQQSATAIAQMHNCRPSMILRRLRLYNIEVHASKTSKIQELVDYDWLRVQYIDNRLRITDIARMLGTGHRRVATALKSFGFDTTKFNTKFDLIADYDWMYMQYVTHRKNQQQIADILGVGVNAVSVYMRRLKIPTHTHCVGFSSIAVEWLEYIMRSDGIYISHASNSGEVKIPNTKYYADGYCNTTNTYYDFHGSYSHGDPRKFNGDDYNKKYNATYGSLYEKTMLRDNIIRQNVDNYVVMWELDWLSFKKHNPITNK